MFNDMTGENNFNRGSEKETPSPERFARLSAALNKFLEQPERPENNPMDVAKIFMAEEASPQEYEDLIGKVELACLSKIKLLERFQIFLRGDCLDEEKQKALESRGFPSVRSVPRAIIGDITDRAIFGSLLIQLGNRVNAAYAKEYKFYDSLKQQDKALVQGPVLIYGFSPINKARLKKIKSVLETGEEYFYGDADDEGEIIPNLHYIDLPKTITWVDKADSHYRSDSLREFFLTLPHLYRLEDYGVSEELLPKMKERVSRYADDEDFARQNSDALACFLLLPRSHFHYVLMAYRILSDIEALEKTNKE